MFDKTIFIGGGPCSGTTLLNSWLCKHPNMAGSPEVWAADAFATLDKHMSKAGWLQANKYATLRKSFYALFENDPLSVGKKHLLHQNTRIASLIKFIEPIFPDAYYIFVLRDGRRVIASMKAKWQKARYQTSLPYYLAQAVRKWCNFAEAICDGKIPRRCLLLRYEDIKPGVDSEIMKFIGEQLHEEINLSERVNSNFPEPMAEDYWQNYLDDKELRLIEYMNPWLKRLGYT